MSIKKKSRIQMPKEPYLSEPFGACGDKWHGNRAEFTAHHPGSQYYVFLKASVRSVPKLPSSGYLDWGDSASCAGGARGGRAEASTELLGIIRAVSNVI